MAILLVEDVFHGIHRNVVDHNLIVEMGSRGQTRVSHISDHIAPFDSMSRLSIKFGKMAIDGLNTITMIDLQHLAKSVCGRFRVFRATRRASAR